MAAMHPSFGILQADNKSFPFLRLKVRAQQMHGKSVKYQHPTFSSAASLQARHTWASYLPFTPSFHPVLSDLPFKIKRLSAIILYSTLKIQPLSLE